MTAPAGVDPGLGRRFEVPITFSPAPLDDVDATAAVIAEPVRRLRTTHWDTADLRLARWGVALAHSADSGWVLQLPATSEGMAAPDGAELQFSGGPEHPPEPALHLVRAYARRAPIELVARLVTMTGETVLLDAQGTVLARLVDDTVSVYSGPRITQRFREIGLFSDSGRLLDLIATRYQAAGAQPALPRALVARALGLVGTPPPEIGSVTLGSAATAGDVVLRALRLSVIRLLRHDPGVRLGRDAEDVHQARVATRRLRSDLRTFRPLVDAAWAEALRDDLRWLGGELGRVRDAEVLRDRLRAAATTLPAADRRSAQAVVAPLVAQVGAARRHLLAAMDTERYIEVIDHLVAAARAPVLTEMAASPARDVLSGLVRRPWRSLKAGAVAARGDVPDEQLHDLRIRAKRCRYAAEAAASATGKHAARFAREVAALQEVLGELHDAVVAEAWLRERSAAPRIHETALFAAGELVALQRDAADRARTGWPSVWKRVEEGWAGAWR
ncbi:MAG TPA: CHAD domain-containing protein [Candidatus Saccharimonadales bacterium]|nr:CHAD domain-containing protein [Candidatus Saccharimonadales bacterium]